jgi:hypothetical protein
MAHTFAHGRVARRLSLVAALALAATVVITPMTRAPDGLVRTMSLSIRGGQGSMCVFFVDLGSPDLDRGAGGDPVQADLAHRTPPQH